MSTARRKKNREKPATAGAAQTPGTASPAPLRPRWLAPLGRSDRAGQLMRALVAFVSALCWVLASPRFDIWILGWIAPLLLIALVDLSPTDRSARRWAYVSGCLVTLFGFSWIYGMLHRFGGLPGPLALLGLLLLAAYQGLVFWGFAWCVRRVRNTAAARGRNLPMAMIAPLSMAAFEFAFPMIFPFHLAICQAGVLPVIQIAELFGAISITALLFAVAGAAYDALLAQGKRQRAVRALPGVLALAATLVFGWVRIHQIDEARAQAPVLRVGLVQANIAFDGPLAHSKGYAERKLGEMIAASAAAEREGAEVVVWPEAPFPWAMDRPPLPSPSLRGLRGVAAPGHEANRFSIPAVLGWLTVDPARPELPYNSALYVRGDEIVARYDKTKLVLFSEYLPFIDELPWLADLLPAAAQGKYARGSGPAIFELPRADGTSVRLAPVICLEDTLAEVGLKLAPHKPQLLVNITNDTWFGAGSEPWQHLALAVFRSVELRNDMVRAVNSGVTAHIDATGRVRFHSRVVDPAAADRKAEHVVVDTAVLTGGNTLYAAIGNLFAWLCLVAAAGLALVWPRLKTSRASSSTQHGKLPG